ncbi:hypothetical protein ACEPAG_4183 [Sanghuangporus baumii]
MHGPLFSCSFIFGLLASALRLGLYASAQVQNVTLQNTNDQLVYIPSLCTDDEECDGGWTIVDLPGSSNGSVTSTNGPTAITGNILPQVFLTFRGSALYVKTSEVSNATANLTVSSLPSGRLESRVFGPSRNFWAFEDLDENQLTTVAVTYLPEDEEGSSETSMARLDIDFFKISVSNASSSVTTSFLPSQTLPTSAFTPSFAPVTTLFSPTATSSSSSRLPIGAIVGGTVGGFVGVLLLVSLLVFLFWRRLRRKDVEQQRKEMSALQAAQQILSVASRRTQLPPLRI